jgi:hypothetical protein
MTRKTHLEVVTDPVAKVGSPPRKLGAAGLALWNSVTAEFAIDDSGGRELLCLACQALDRAEELKSIIDKEGAVLRSKAGVKSHPAVRDEIQCRALVARLLKQLGVTLEPLRTGGDWGIA